MRSRIFQWSLLVCLCFGFPAPSRANPAVATFKIAGNRILKDGSEFIIHGVNVNGPGWQWNRKTVQDIDAISKIWKFNLIRVNCKIQPLLPGVKGKATDKKEANDLDEIVQEFTSRNIVVLIDPRDRTGGYYQDPAQPAGAPSLTDLASWEKDLAARYKNNPYVWFEVMSGPGSHDDKRAQQQWLTTHERVIKAIRQEAGAENIIVCEGSGKGSEDGSNGTYPVPDSYSAILGFGPNLSRRYANLLYSFHVNEEWRPGGEEKLSNYVDRVQAAGLALFVSEYGPADYRDYAAPVEAMFAVCKPRHIGRCVWHWFPSDRHSLCAPDDKNGGWQVDTLDGSKPSNLSWLGDKAWDDNHGIMPLHGASLDRTGWTATAFAAPTGDRSRQNQPEDALGGEAVTQSDYWTSGKAQEPGQWFQVDMGAKCAFTRLLIDTRAFAGDYPRGYEVYTSNDGIAWGMPVAQGKNDQSVLRLSFPVRTARYIKVVQMGKTWHHWAIADFQVYAPYGASLPASVHKKDVKETVVPSHGWSATGGPGRWNDTALPLLPSQPREDDYRRASTTRASQPGDYYQVDMGEPQKFDKIVFTCGRYTDDYPRGYEVYVSNNGTQWGKPIAAGRGRPTTTILFPPRTSRYIRVVQTRSSPNYWGIAEFRIYSAVGSETSSSRP